ncbi:hypothetical protein G9A89_023343 [Geosiphon pyriformis]|nr:hypothetical protein G9A89_023343 [Geosiphon pyriformis]
MFNGQHAQVPAMCGHFKNQRTKEPLIEFKDTSMPPTIETYQTNIFGRPKRQGKWDHMPCLELTPTCEEQEQRLADLNTKLCNHCLIPCHFQYCDECDLMFNSLPRILFLITKLPESEEEVLIIKDMFQDPTEDTETEQYLTYLDLSKELELKWYSNNEERICPERVHDTDASFNLQYPGQSPIIIAPHSLVKIDLKIALEISVSTMIQVAFQSSLAKKGINIKGGIIDAGYMENIIVMLQNNLNRPYKIESQEKIAQAIFLPLVKILQLTLVTIREELDLTARGINGPKICSLADVANLYLLAKAHKHFKIPIHNPTEDVIEIPKGTLISSISTDSQNPEKSQFIPDFAQLFLFCDITSQVWNLPKESYLFTPEEINKLNLGNLSTLQQMQLKVLLNQYANVFASENEFGCTDIMKHQIDTIDAQLIKQ